MFFMFSCEGREMDRLPFRESLGLCRPDMDKPDEIDSMEHCLLGCAIDNTEACLLASGLLASGPSVFRLAIESIAPISGPQLTLSLDGTS
jgi:hypothetical protein